MSENPEIEHRTVFLHYVCNKHGARLIHRNHVPPTLFWSSKIDAYAIIDDSGFICPTTLIKTEDNRTPCNPVYDWQWRIVHMYKWSDGKVSKRPIHPNEFDS